MDFFAPHVFLPFCTYVLCISMVFFTLSLFMQPFNSHRYADWGSHMWNGQQSVSQQPRIIEHEEQMPRWQHCLGRRQLLHPNWWFISICLRQILQTSDYPFNNICSMVLDKPCFQLCSSVQFCLCVNNQAPLSHQSNISICFLECHFTVSHIMMFTHSLCTFVPSVVFILHYKPFLITSHPRRYSIKKTKVVKSFSAISSSHLYLCSKLQRSMNFLDEIYSSLMPPLSPHT